jgi:molecular chaperone GrpE
MNDSFFPRESIEEPSCEDDPSQQEDPRLEEDASQLVDDSSHFIDDALDNVDDIEPNDGSDLSEDAPISEDAPNDLEIPPIDEGPQFGAVDIVEAFTALRHEWRGQIKESRALAELIQNAVADIQASEANLLTYAAHAQAALDDDGSDDAAAVKPFVLLIVETDHQLTRALAGLAKWDANQRLRIAADALAVEQFFAQMGRWARWLSRPLLAFVAEQRAAQESSAENPAMEGLNLVLARLRRVMKEHRIERIEVLGEEFDAETMHAIGTVATTAFPPGHVAEQLSPAYRWQGRNLRFADVRVAQ